MNCPKCGDLLEWEDGAYCKKCMKGAKMIKEDLIYSDYRLFETRNSQIDKGSTLEVEVGLKCPHCKKRIEIIQCEKSSDCNYCGLHLTRHGNLLSCTMR